MQAIGIIFKSTFDGNTASLTVLEHYNKVLTKPPLLCAMGGTGRLCVLGRRYTKVEALFDGRTPLVSTMQKVWHKFFFYV